MRSAIALLAVLVSASIASAEPTVRANAVIEGLGVDEQTANRLVDVIGQYDQEITKLQRARADLRRRLVVAQRKNPAAIETLIDDSLQNQRALLKADERLVQRVRALLPSTKTAHLLMLLAVTEPTHGDDWHIAHSQRADALWPPTGVCDPFASMHRCPR